MSDLLHARATLLDRAWDAFESTTEYLWANRVALTVLSAGLLPTVQRGCFEQPGRWDWPDDHGRPERPCAILEAIDEQGEVIDLVAWPLDAPSDYRTMFGYAVILNEAAMWDTTSYAFGKALDIHRTPLEWLQANCQGIVCLDLDKAARILIDAPGMIAVRDTEHAAEVAKAMDTVVDLRKIVIPA